MTLQNFRCRPGEPERPPDSRESNHPLTGCRCRVSNVSLRLVRGAVCEWLGHRIRSAPRSRTPVRCRPCRLRPSSWRPAQLLSVLSRPESRRTALGARTSGSSWRRPSSRSRNRGCGESSGVNLKAVSSIRVGPIKPNRRFSELLPGRHHTALAPPTGDAAPPLRYPARSRTAGAASTPPCTFRSHVGFHPSLPHVSPETGLNPRHSS